MMDPATMTEKPEALEEFIETVVEIKRTSKKTKGGNRLSFTCLAVVGDGAGKVGTALSRAPNVVSSVKKSMRRARKEMIEFPLIGEARTIPHEIEMTNGACRVLLKPAPAGTGIRAGGPVRSVLQAAGIQNVVAKILGSGNKKGNIDTVLIALSKLSEPSDRLHDRIHKSKKKKETK